MVQKIFRERNNEEEEQKNYTQDMERRARWPRDGTDGVPS